MAAEYGEQYGMQGQMRRNDEHGNPIGQTIGGEGMHGSGGAYGTTPTVGKQQHHEGMLHQQQQQQPELRRSGSSSSSSSEDDGQGGRRKKGIKDKIKEKLPGGQAGQNQEGLGGEQHMMTGTEEGGEKKGMMDKIKEKIPGMH